MRILGSTSHNINFWNDCKTFSQFSVVLDQYSRDKKKKKNLAKTRLSFIIEPFRKQRPAGEGRDNDAKYGCAAAGVF